MNVRNNELEIMEMGLLLEEMVRDNSISEEV
jgi:hypothetical protein